MKNYFYFYFSVALNKPAFQSSLWPDRSRNPIASKAVDGNSESNFFHSSCSHTDITEDKPWWAVDLEAEYLVTSVTITNRGDCCGENLQLSNCFGISAKLQKLLTHIINNFTFYILAERLSNFTISVGDLFDPNNTDSFDPSTFTQCAHVPGRLGLGETRVIQCNQPVPGRFVTLNLNRKIALTICEFQVHGTPIEGQFDEIIWD